MVTQFVSRRPGGYGQQSAERMQFQPNGRPAPTRSVATHFSAAGFKPGRRHSEIPCAQSWRSPQHLCAQKPGSGCNRTRDIDTSHSYDFVSACFGLGWLLAHVRSLLATPRNHSTSQHTTPIHSRTCCTGQTHSAQRRQRDRCQCIHRPPY